MRIVDDGAIRAHANVRFRSEYHYAVFEYWRSAKVLRFLAQHGADRLGRVLDDGCGGGGMCVSLGEESDITIGIDMAARFTAAGTELASEKHVRNVRFASADGHALPFRDGTFDTVLSHAVIEHVTDPLGYLREARRVLRSGGLLYLQTAPYLSSSGVHLPRLRVSVPVHLFIGRPLAFRLFRWLGTHMPAALHSSAGSSSFVAMAGCGETKHDDLRYNVTVRSLRRHIAAAGFRVRHEELYVSGLARRWFPGVMLRAVPRTSFVRDVLVTNMEYLLQAD
jgi:ubiquinone/menaquinone biosynthesis C-methylase UbiE